MARRRNFSVDDIQLDTFNKTHILAWTTRYLDYEFANQLNRLYGLQLAREIDFKYWNLKDKELNCINYLYYDDKKQLMYILFQNSVNGEAIATGAESYDKVLVIYGRDARERCLEMYDEFTIGCKVEGEWDVLGREHEALVEDVKLHGIAYVDFFDFSKEEKDKVDPTVWLTSVMHTGNPSIDKKIDKKLLAIHDGMKEFLTAMEGQIALEENMALQEERKEGTMAQNFVVDKIGGGADI